MIDQGFCAPPRPHASAFFCRYRATLSMARARARSGTQAKHIRKYPGSLAWQSLPGVKRTLASLARPVQSLFSSSQVLWWRVREYRRLMMAMVMAMASASANRGRMGGRLSFSAHLSRRNFLMSIQQNIPADAGRKGILAAFSLDSSTL